MATSSRKTEKIEAELQKLKQTLDKYQQLFLEDGYIDTDEQQKLDQMQGLIQQAAHKWATLKGEQANAQTDSKDFSEVLQQIKAETEALLAQLNKG